MARVEPVWLSRYFIVPARSRIIIPESESVSTFTEKERKKVVNIKVVWLRTSEKQNQRFVAPDQFSQLLDLAARGSEDISDL